MNILCCGLFPALQRTLSLDRLNPGKVNRVRSVTLSVGGKGVNAARVLHTLGADPLLVSFAGGTTGDQIRKMVADETLNAAWIQTEAETRICQTLLPDAQPDFTELVEESAPLRPSEWKNLVRTFSQTCSRCEAVILSGTLPSHAPQEIYTELLRHADGKPVLIDSCGEALRAALEYRPAWVKINAEELKKTVRLCDHKTEKNPSLPERITAARELIDRGALAVAVTDGPHPALLVTREQTSLYTLPAIPFVNPLGGGDSVNAGTVFARQKGHEPDEAFLFGLACGLSNAMSRLPGSVQITQIRDYAASIQRKSL